MGREWGESGESGGRKWGESEERVGIEGGESGDRKWGQSGTIRKSPPLTHMKQLSTKYAIVTL